MYPLTLNDYELAFDRTHLDPFTPEELDKRLAKGGAIVVHVRNPAVRYPPAHGYATWEISLHQLPTGGVFVTGKSPARTKVFDEFVSNLPPLLVLGFAIAKTIALHGLDMARTTMHDPRIDTRTP